MLLQRIVGPDAQVAEAVLGEECRVCLEGRQFPGGGLGAVLAELQRMGMAGLGPGATDARKPVGLVLFEQRGGHLGQRLFAPQDLHHRFGRTPTATGIGIGLEMAFGVDKHQALPGLG